MVTSSMTDVDDDQAVDDTGESSPAEEPKELVFGSVNEFVREHLRHIYRRRIDGQPWIWVGDWWRYPEAEDVLDALWRAWEHLSLDGRTGKSVWWRDHARPHMEALMTKNTSPFPAHHLTTTTTVLDPLPYIEPPAGTYPDQRGAAAVAAAIVQLLADRTADDWKTRIAGYLLPGRADQNTLAALPAADPPDGTPDVTDAGNDAADVIVPTRAGHVAVALIRHAPADPWLAASIQPLD